MLALFPSQTASRPVATGERVRPYGESVLWPGRPVALAVSADGKRVFAKDDEGLVVMDGATGAVLQRLASPGGTSLTGLVVTPSGDVLLTDARSSLRVARPVEGKYAWEGAIALPKPPAPIGGDAYPCGIALLPKDGKGARVLIALSRGNEIVEVDLAGRKVVRRMPTAPAPFGVLVDGGRIYISCWGRPPARRSAPASGTEVDVDDRGIATGGTVDAFDLATGKRVARYAVGLQPSGMVALGGGRVAVALANDDALAVLSRDGKVRRVPVEVRAGDPFGSAPNALALRNGRLYVALGGGDAVAVLDARTLKTEGSIPTGWYPDALAFAGDRLLVANAKGDGAPAILSGKGSTATRALGSVSRFVPPTGGELRRVTAEAKRLNLLPKREARRNDVKLIPVPARVGEPSVFRHVVYVIKENRTYDQVLGDMKTGNGDPSLCLYGRGVTPNIHALAAQFVLLDNYFCNGIISSDGHAWSIEGNATSYLERSFGGWTRSYPFGDDPLSASRSGYLWDHVLAGGRSFRNHGEFDYATPVPSKATFADLYRDFVAGKPQRFETNIGVARLRRYSSDVPGWSLSIPDVLRANRFLADVKERGLPDLTILYLPQDHTSGLTPGMPTPRAHVADNDLALGRVIEGLSHSPAWKETCVFVIEDDPQDGFDHVDGRRSTCLVVSPYSRGRGTVSEFFNGTGVLRTMLAMLELPPRTLAEARSPLMTACFGPMADFAPYTAIPNRVPLDELNPSPQKQTTVLRAYARKRLPLSRPDAGDDEMMNRILWRAAKGAKPYPSWAVGERRRRGGS